MRIYTGVLWRGGVKLSTALISLAIHLVTLETKPALLYYYIMIRSPSSAFQWSQMHDLKWLFRVKFFFVSVCPAFDLATLENNCVKTNKDRHILSVAVTFGRYSSFWQYKVYVDIHAGRRFSRKGSSKDRWWCRRFTYSFFSSCVTS